jgi:hypothetical protein
VEHPLGPLEDYMYHEGETVGEVVDDKR